MEAVLGLVLPRVFRWEVYGLEHVPRGPAIIVSNHLSVFDPPLTLMALRQLRPKRHLYFLAKSSLYTVRSHGFAYAGWLLNQIEAIPLKQDEADLTAFRKALHLLGEGKMIGIYPEGGVTRLDETRVPQPGLALLAHLAGVPIVPLGVTGTRPLWVRGRDGHVEFSKMRARFGEPLPPPPRKRMDEAARMAYTRYAMDTCYALVRESLACGGRDLAEVGKFGEPGS